MKQSCRILMLVAVPVLMTGVAKAEGDDILADETPVQVKKTEPVAVPKMPELKAETPVTEKVGPVSSAPVAATRKPAMTDVSTSTEMVYDGTNYSGLVRIVDSSTGIACYSFKDKFNCLQKK